MIGEHKATVEVCPVSGAAHGHPAGAGYGSVGVYFFEEGIGDSGWWTDNGCTFFGCIGIVCFPRAKGEAIGLESEVGLNDGWVAEYGTDFWVEVFDDSL